MAGGGGMIVLIGLLLFPLLVIAEIASKYK
jgi:hypothetical protein